MRNASFGRNQLRAMTVAAFSETKTATSRLLIAVLVCHVSAEPMPACPDGWQKISSGQDTPEDHDRAAPFCPRCVKAVAIPVDYLTQEKAEEVCFYSGAMHLDMRPEVEDIRFLDAMENQLKQDAGCDGVWLGPELGSIHHREENISDAKQLLDWDVEKPTRTDDELCLWVDESSEELTLSKCAARTCTVCSYADFQSVECRSRFIGPTPDSNLSLPMQFVTALLGFGLSTSLLPHHIGLDLLNNSFSEDVNNGTLPAALEGEEGTSEFIFILRPILADIQKLIENLPDDGVQTSSLTLDSQQITATSTTL